MNSNLKKIIMTALFAALACVATMSIRIPTPGTGGYIHPGDAIVILAGIILGPVYGMLAGGIGSALSDLIGGYFVYVPITLVIKGLVALVSGLIYQKMCRSGKKRYIAVILGGSTSDKRFSDAKALLNYGFAAYSLVTVTPESPLPAVPVTLGTQKTVQSVLTSENALLLEKSRANGLTQAVSLPESIDAPVEEGEPLGTLDIFDADGTPVASLPLLAGESIPHLTWSELFCRLLKLAYCGA